MESTQERTCHIRRCTSCEPGEQTSWFHAEHVLSCLLLQFVDPLILMRVIKMEAGRRIAWLIAEKSMRRNFVGGMARAAGAVPVGRALDSTKPGSGKIYLPDPQNDPTLIRGVGTQFEKECQVGGLLILPTVNGDAANTEISEIRGNEEVRLKKEFKGDVALQQLTGKRKENGEARTENGDVEKAQEFQGSSYKTAPKVDQSKVYDAVFDRLHSGGCVGIFPEGGSHDRTELLPLKRTISPWLLRIRQRMLTLM